MGKGVKERLAQCMMNELKKGRGPGAGWNQLAHPANEIILEPRRLPRLHTSTWWLNLSPRLGDVQVDGQTTSPNIPMSSLDR
jgi:hypothetical protein